MLLNKLCWRLANDDNGGIIATEYLLIVGILVFGLTAGLKGLRDSINTQFGQIGQTISEVNRPYLDQLKVVNHNQNVNVVNVNVGSCTECAD